MDPKSDRLYLGGRVKVIVGDITRQNVEAIVNAANASLLGGGGVDGAIHRAGGRAVLEACREIRRTSHPQGLPTGEAVITTAGDMPARYVIHTVGPVFGQHRGEEAALLSSCYVNSLRLAADHSLTSIAFPAISTGAFGYPLHQAAAASSKAIESFLSEDDQLEDVRLVFSGTPDAVMFIKHQKFSA
ncbi:MAG TPA: O-acetyl-ADP-ribose deacetylase [Pyrinomonadaceae bacterium]|nr:O-acetyl-ADP-ribose deacetylase [Pyrinomonadaceae bacterium]